MGGRKESHANPAEQAEKQVRAYELKLQGHSLRAIAKIMTAEGVPVSHQTVSNLIDRECAERVLPLADAVRKQEIDRFDQWLVRLNERIDQGGSDLSRAIEVAVKVSERRAKLLGADSPVVTEVNATVEHKPTEILDLIAHARQQTAEAESRLKHGPA